MHAYLAPDLWVIVILGTLALIVGHRLATAKLRPAPVRASRRRPPRRR
jgi:hypothetical protein